MTARTHLQPQAPLVIGPDEAAAACARVAEMAQQVRIHDDRIAHYAEELIERYPLVAALDSDLHYVTPDLEKTALYVIALDSINFGSGYFADGGGLEYAPIARGLKTAFCDGTLAHPGQWLTASAETLSPLFGCDVYHPLMADFAGHLQASARILMEQHGGRAENLLQETGYSAANLAAHVAAWPHFYDVSAYNGQMVPFFKRAQILAADMALALGTLTDIDRLTCFADNMIPHTLRRDGILKYNLDLARRIDDGQLLTHGSAEEIEIRACALHAVEMMKTVLLSRGRAITSVNLDHLLWHRGYELGAGFMRPHRTLTTAY